jgi:predicted MFS family arabinose efflux permease
MNTVFMGVSNDQAAYLMRIYHLNASEIALPMMLAGLGVIAGSLIGGRVAGQRYRYFFPFFSF